MHDLNENRSGHRRTKVGWLPDNWDCAAFGQIARRVSKPVAVAKGEYYREIGLRSHGRGVFHKEPVLGADLGEKRVFRVQPGALVFNIVFAWEQAVAMASEAEAGMIASHRFPMFVGRDGKAEATFLLRYFLTPRGKHELGLASPGGAGRNKTLGQEDLTRLPVPLPPIAEQRRIVEVLATWDAALRDVEALIAAQRRRKTGLMQQLLTGQTRLPGFEGDWGKAKLCQVCGIRFSNVDKKAVPGEESVRLCNYTDVFGRRYIRATGEFMAATAPASAVKRFGLIEDDVVMTKDSESREDIASCAVVLEPLQRVLCGYHLALLRPDRRQMDGRFLAAILEEHGVHSQFVRMANGVTRYGLTYDAVQSVRLTVPPLPEQRAIAAVLGAADAELHALQEKRAALELQKRGLLQQLLSGARRLL